MGVSVPESVSVQVSYDTMEIFIALFKFVYLKNLKCSKSVYSNKSREFTCYNHSVQTVVGCV